MGIGVPGNYKDFRSMWGQRDKVRKLRVLLIDEVSDARVRMCMCMCMCTHALHSCTHGDMRARMHPCVHASMRIYTRVDIYVVHTDQVSMLSGELLDELDRMLREIRHYARVQQDGHVAVPPFGGIQLIVCGDFFQLVSPHSLERRWA